jgi:2-methylcitrate dehydratase PrpD
MLGTTLPHLLPVRRLAASVLGPAQSTITGGSRTGAWHAGSAVLPAALAHAEREDVDGRILGLSPAELTQALGIAGSDASGTME